MDVLTLKWFALRGIEWRAQAAFVLSVAVSLVRCPFAASDNLTRRHGRGGGGVDVLLWKL